MNIIPYIAFGMSFVFYIQPLMG